MTGTGRRPSRGGAGDGDWPEDATVGGMVAAGGDADVREEAVRVADAMAESGRVLVADLTDPGPALDATLGVADAPGLRHLRGGGRTLRDLARRPSGHGFLYLPAGDPEDAPGDVPPAEDARILGLLAEVGDRIRDRGGRLLLYLGRRDRWPEAPGRLVDAVVVLGAGGAPPGTPEALPVIRSASGAGVEAAGTEPDGTESGADAPAGSGPGSSGGWRRHRHTTGPPWGRIAVGVAAVAALAGGWWWLASRAGPSVTGEGAAPARSAPAATPDTAPHPTGRDGDATGAAPPADGEAAPAGRAAVIRDAPELPYSVLIASYAQWSQARERLERWGGEEEGPVYFAAPTRVRGRLYWRLFAGSLPNRSAAERLMERLVESGRKDRARSWDVRPVGRAFREGVYGTRDSAADRAAALRDRGFPAYPLAAAGPDTVWQVYLGGYESAGAAEPLARRLRESEIEARLVTRRGESDVR